MLFLGYHTLVLLDLVFLNGSRLISLPHQRPQRNIRTGLPSVNLIVALFPDCMLNSQPSISQGYAFLVLRAS